jgi:hypothetical protein
MKPHPCGEVFLCAEKSAVLAPALVVHGAKLTPKRLVLLLSRKLSAGG